MDEAFEGMHDFRKIVDDVVAFDSDPLDHIHHVDDYSNAVRRKAYHSTERSSSSARLRFSLLASSLHQRATQ